MHSAVPHRATRARTLVVSALSTSALLAAILAIAPAAASAATPSAPFLQCPAVGNETSCRYVIDVTGSGGTQNVQVYADDSQTTFDGTNGDEIAVAIMNDSATPLTSIDIGVDQSGDNLWGFDGDGLCSGDNPPSRSAARSRPAPEASRGDPYDYQGPNTTYTPSPSGSADAGVITFPSALQPGQSTYTSFSSNGSTGPDGDLQAQVGSAPYVELDQTLTDTYGNAQEDATLAEPAGVTNVTDQLSLEGPNAAQVTSGTVTYSVWTNANCTAPAYAFDGNNSAGPLPISNGTIPTASIGAGLSTNATYYWLAQLQTTESGVPVNLTSPCGQSAVAFGSPGKPVTPTITGAVVSGGGAQGPSISVPAGTPVSAISTTITPGAGSASAPSGNVYFTWYSDNGCGSQQAAAGPLAVSNGTASGTAPAGGVVLPAGASYYLQAVYTGDGVNAPETSCAVAEVTVGAAATSTTSTTTTTTTSTATSTSTSSAALPPPVLYQDVNVTPVSGQVYVKLPTGYGASAAIAEAELDPLASASFTKGKGFIPLSQARQIPVGSIFDTRGGTVAVAAASTTAGKQYTANITAGVFQLEQNRKQKGLTQLNLMDTQNRKKVCASSGKGKPKKGQARIASSHGHLSTKVLGLLKSTDNGKFATKGTFSSATVQGTAYYVRDECAGTLTVVSRGQVLVDYFRRHKNVVVKAGYYYLAKSSGAKSSVEKMVGKPTAPRAPLSAAAQWISFTTAPAPRWWTTATLATLTVGDRRV